MPDGSTVVFVAPVGPGEPPTWLLPLRNLGLDVFPIPPQA